ncbi:MAG: peptidylprolyl isomerase [Pseudomonadota bacterium]|nr:peptidylprolyl isomerase [Pseudomonadota bacterium]
MTAFNFCWKPILGALIASTLSLTALAASGPEARSPREAPVDGDHIAVVVNQEVVTAGEIDRRLARAISDAGRSNARVPPEPEMRKLALDALIDERVMLSAARDSGMKVDDPEIDRAIQSIASQNQITLPQLRQRLSSEGTDYGRFRSNVRDQIMIERMREREVYQRIKISDDDVDKYLAEQRAALGTETELNIAQILLPVPDGADAATVEASRTAAAKALARVQAGESFAAVAREVSADGNREKGGEIGLKPMSRLPDAFVAAVKSLQPGEVSPTLLRTGAGFHVLRLVARDEPQPGTITQTRARHILLRTSPEVTPAVATRRLAEFRQEIESGKARFEDIARRYSEDGSASSGGDLGWSSPGVMVPEFEKAMDALPIGGVSQPVQSRFGVHLIQVLERRKTSIDTKQLREQARNVLRERRFEPAYEDWTRELRSRAYVEYREAPP